MLTASVRPRTEADVTPLMAVLREVHERDGYPIRWHEPAWLTPAEAVGTWTGLVDEAVAGHIALAEEHGPALSRLFVAPAARGSGLADLLLDAAVDAAAERFPGARVTLEVHARALPAIAFYERHGWVRTGTHRAVWTERDGTPALAHTYRAPA